MYAEFHLFAVSQAASSCHATGHGAVPRVPKGNIPAYLGSQVDGPGADGTSLSVPVLRTVHTHLMRAEQAKRDDDRMLESEAYNELGLFFERAGNLPLATYQYRRCLGIAEELGWEDGRMATHMALGMGADRISIHSATVEHGTRLGLIFTWSFDSCLCRRAGSMCAMYQMPHWPPGRCVALTK